MPAETSRGSRGIDLPLHAVRLALEIILGRLLRERDPAEPLDAPRADPAGHDHPDRETVHRRQRCAIELAREQDLGAQRLGEIDRPAESEPVALALHLIEADELDVPGPLGRPPPHGADR